MCRTLWVSLLATYEFRPLVILSPLPWPLPHVCYNPGYTARIYVVAVSSLSLSSQVHNLHAGRARTEWNYKYCPMDHAVAMERRFIEVIKYGHHMPKPSYAVPANTIQSYFLINFPCNTLGASWHSLAALPFCHYIILCHDAKVIIICPPDSGGSVGANI